MKEAMKINSELVEAFCKEFKSNYLTLKKFKTLTKNQCMFHLFNHWNILHIDNNYLYHSYLNGGNGEIEKTFSKIKLSELDKKVFIRYKDTFILFKVNKGILKPEIIYNELDRFSNIDNKRIWLHKNEIQVRRKFFIINKNMEIEWKMVDVFTGEEIK